MASGIVHDRITYATAALAALGGMYFGLALSLVVVTSVSLVFGGIWLSPDLDLARSRPSKRWGILSFIWYPLRRRGHRSKLSHGWLVGSLFRIAWLLLCASPAIVAAVWVLGPPPTWMWTYVGWAIVGVILGGEIHLLTDLITTGDNDRYS